MHSIIRDFSKPIITLLIFLFLIGFGNNMLLRLNTAQLFGSRNNIPCNTDWECESWTACNSQGKAFRKCLDVNNCERSITPDTIRNCYLTPELLLAYQDDYEKKLSIINVGDSEIIKIDATRSLPEQNDSGCQYINDTAEIICYYFNLSPEKSIKFLTDTDSSLGKMIFGKGEIIMTGIESIREFSEKNAAGFSVYPTNNKDIFFIGGDRKIKNNVLSWKEIYFDASTQKIIFYADAGIELKNIKKSFINIKIGGKEEYNINISLPDNCNNLGKYKLNGIFINNINNTVFPNPIEFDCNPGGESYSRSIEIEPIAISRDFKVLHLFVHSYKNNEENKDDIQQHYLFDLSTGNVFMAPDKQ